jgi:hypothetical protein
LRSLELLLLLSLILTIAPLVGLLSPARLIRAFLVRARLIRAFLVRARLIRAFLLCACLIRAFLVGASLIRPVLGHESLIVTAFDTCLRRASAAPISAAASLFRLGRRLNVLILSAASIVLSALRLRRGGDEQQRRGCRKRKGVSHTVPQIL